MLKKQTISIAILVESLLVIQNFVYAGQNAPATKRWDLMMIDEAPIWKNLLVNYPYAERQKHWLGRKEALKQIVSRFPNSQWADDAELILACGKFEFEGKAGIDDLKSNAEAYSKGYFGDAEAAIEALRSIIKKYANEKTIVKPVWSAGGGCEFDDVWLYNQGSLFSLNPDGSVKTSKPFDRTGAIPQQDKEVLTYFEHLDKYPNYTADVARIFISEIYGHQKKCKEASEELEKVIANVEQFTETLQADRIVAMDVNGFFIRRISRPQYVAHISLMGYYEKLGSDEKAIATTDSFAAIVNQGTNYGMMKLIGEFYERHGLQSKAKSQYQLALNRINEYIAADRERSKYLEYIKEPTTDEERSPRLIQEATELKAKIR